MIQIIGEGGNRTLSLVRLRTLTCSTIELHPLWMKDSNKEPIDVQIFCLLQNVEVHIRFRERSLAILGRLGVCSVNVLECGVVGPKWVVGLRIGWVIMGPIQSISQMRGMIF